MKVKDIEYLSEQVKSNSSILGLHVQAGNCGTEGKAHVDTLGFVHFIPKVAGASAEETYSPEPAASALPGALTQTLDHQTNVKHFSRIGIPKQSIGAENIDNCWICGKWKQVAFEFSEPAAKNKENEVRGECPIYHNLELQIEGENVLHYPEEKKLMMREDKGKKGKTKVRQYKLYRMLPIEAKTQKPRNQQKTSKAPKRRGREGSLDSISSLEN